MARIGWRRVKKEIGIYVNQKGAIRVRATYSPPTGKKKERQCTLPPGTEIEVAILVRTRMEKALESEVDKGAPSKITTLGVYAERWLRQKAKRRRKSTLESYMTPLAHHILPLLGELQVAAISRVDVDAWVAWAERARKPNGDLYSHESVKTWFKVLLLILRDACVDLGLADPTERITPPTRQETGGRRETRTLSAEQLGEVLEQVRQIFPTWYAEALTLAYSGIRAGELYALRIEDIDQERRILRIRRATARGEINLTKTYEPRDAVVPQLVIDAIREHRKTMMTTDRRGLESNLVFPSNCGTPRTPAGIRAVLQAAARATGIDINVTSQVLRRTFNTLLLDAQVDRLVLRSMIGHTTEQMTGKYAGIRYEAKDQASARLLKLVVGDGDGS